MTMRIRCEVLKAIAILDNATSESVANMLTDLTSTQVQKAIYNLLSQDRIFKVDQESRKGSQGRALFIYDVNEDWEPVKRHGNTGKKKGRKSNAESLRTNGVGRAIPVVMHRDRKIRLLQGLVNKVSGSQRDLMIGILADFGHKFTDK